MEKLKLAAQQAKNPTIKPPIVVKKKTNEEKVKEIVSQTRVEKKYTVSELKELETKANKDKKYTTVDSSREPVNIVFIGHVDAGKSTLSGRILVNCGEVDEQDLRAYEKSAA